MPSMPGGNREHASGYVKALAADSHNAEAAYLFMQWATSPPVSLARVMLPYTLRDPYRLSHYTSPLYRALWPNAKDYLISLNNAANGAVIDMIMPGWQDYALSHRPDVHRRLGRRGPEERACSKAAAEWDAITEQARRRRAARRLPAVHEAARLLRRPHDREARHGRALTEPDWPIGAGRPRSPRGRERVGDRRSSPSARAGRTLGEAGDASRRRPPAARRALSGWTDRHFDWLLVAPAVAADPGAVDLSAALLGLGRVRQLRLPDSRATPLSACRISRR